MCFCSKKTKSFSQSLSALWLILVVLSASILLAATLPTSDFCPLAKEVEAANENDPLCDIRTYIKRNQTPKKPKTWWEKFWSTDNFPAARNAENTKEQKFSSVFRHRLCANDCCLNSTNTSNQKRFVEAVEITPAKINFAVFQAENKINFLSQICTTEFVAAQAQPRAPPVLFS
jgi:hypothetical protein